MELTLPRLSLGVLPTPLVAADRLRAELGCAPVLVKRDDLAGFGVAGNKTRPLEYLLGDAVARGVEVLVTGGGPDSNFVPAAALAARVAGLGCELVVWGSSAAKSPNLTLAAAAGARIRAPSDATPTRRACGAGYDGRERVDLEVERVAAELAGRGRRPLAVPRGGSTALGAVGFARAADELVDQIQLGASGPPASVVLSVGSGGSCAGLLAGLAAARTDWPVLGVSVSRPPEEITARILTLAGQCAQMLGTPPPHPDHLEIVDGRGPGFGVASPRDRAAAGLALGTEGLLLDDTYGAKAFALMLDRLRAGAPGPVVFWHTGGVVSAVTPKDAPATSRAATC